MKIKTHTIEDDVNFFFGHPYRETSQVNIFEREMSENIGYSIWHSGSSHYADLLVKGVDLNTTNPKMRDIVLVNESSYDAVRKFLNKKNFVFSEDHDGISLFSEKATEKMQVINFKYNANGMNRQALFVHTPVPIEILEVSAYMTRFGKDEEILQKALVEHDIVLGNHPCAHGTSSFIIYNSEEEAQQSIDKQVFDYLKDSVGDDYVGAYISGHSDKYRYPLSLSDEDIKLVKSNIVILLGGVPQIKAVHTDGKAIVNTNNTNKFPLLDYYDKEKGILLDIGLNDGQNLYANCVPSCSNDYQKALDIFRRKIENRITELEGSVMFDLNGDVARYAGYQIDTSKIKLRVIGKEKMFK